MSTERHEFEIGIEFSSVLRAISKQIYETPLAFLRENVQNAVDAVRIQAFRTRCPVSDDRFRIEVDVSKTQCSILDNGCGMSELDLQQFFWTIGASGKRTDEAQNAGCVGMFGIGGFANFGVCDQLTVTSQTDDEEIGTETSLSRHDIESAGMNRPRVKSRPSDAAKPRGTKVIGTLSEDPNVEHLKLYLADFVRYAQERIFFNGDLLSGVPLIDDSRLERWDRVAPNVEWEWQGVRVTGHLFQDANHGLILHLSALTIDERDIECIGLVQFQNGAIDVFKRGFKLCATKLSTVIGVSGHIDCETLSPTAGRDSLDAESASLLNRLAACLERHAILAILDDPERIEQHTRIFQYVVQHSLSSSLGQVNVMAGDDQTFRLAQVRQSALDGRDIYFSTPDSHNDMLAQVIHAQGGMVIRLPSDRYKQRAIRMYLEQECSGKALDGHLELRETYTDLRFFEQVFLSELEQAIRNAYDVRDATIIAGALTQSVPVHVNEDRPGELIIYVDVRHLEIVKLENLGITPVLYSMIAAFTREYLGSALRKHSPKFFGDGALNLDWLAKSRSELWVLVRDDIEILSRGTRREVVRSSDVRVVVVGEPDPARESGSNGPKLLRIVGSDEVTPIDGYYLRLPDGATKAYGDVIEECDDRGVVWAGNRILFVGSDGVNTAFQFEIRLDRLLLLSDGEQLATEGAEELDRPAQESYGGIYFPIPSMLVSVLVPLGDDEIRIEVRTELIDMTTSRSWQPSLVS